jgi:anionic cell wall polymer biosynthesis LytR-Cps2A-Psr (LCP) family protein
MEQLLLRVEEIIGFRPDGYVLVDLSVFEQLVDTMGGVTFNVPVDMHYEDPSQGLSINLSAGEQHLDGAQAMQVVRFRSGYATQDLGRVETQRAFLSAALQQWTSFKGLIHLPAAFKLVLSASKTDLTARELVWLCESAVLCSWGEIDTRTLPGEASYIAGGSYYVLDAAGVCETINACCNPYQQAVAVSNLYIRVG